MEKSFEEYLGDMVKFYKRQDLHINNNDTESEKRFKDINFGELKAYEDIAKKYEEQIYKGILKKNKYEYLGIYDNPFVQTFYFKVMADNYDDAKRDFLNKLLQDKSINESEFNDLSQSYNYDVRIIPLFDIETIENIM